MGIASHNRRLARLEETQGYGGPPPIFALEDWADGCPRCFEPWEMDQIPEFKAVARDQLVAAGKIRERDRDRVRFMTTIIVYPPEREDEEEKYRRVRPLLRQMAPALKARYEERLRKQRAG